MKTTDWISAFVTLIATGVGFFISGPKAAAACIIIGTLGTLILHFWSKGANGKTREDVPAVKVKDSFNPRQKQEFNPIFAPKIEIGTFPLTPPNLPSVATNPPAKKRMPNLKSIGARVVNVFCTSSNSNTLFEEMAQTTGAWAVVVAFRNESIGDTCSAFDVEARLRFKNEDGVEINTGVDNGCWLDTWNESISIGVEETKHVVLLIRKSDDYTYIPYKRSHKSGNVPLSLEDLHNIEVKLIDGRDSTILGIATIRVDDDSTKSIRRP